MSILPPPPYHDATRAAWLVHADALQDAAAPERQWLEALRFAEGVRRRPTLVLVGILTTHIMHRDWVGTLFPAPHLRTEDWRGFWRSLSDLRWMTERGAKGSGCWPLVNKSVPNGGLLLAAPGDWPLLCECRPRVARAFYLKASEGLKVEVHEGSVCLGRYCGVGATSWRPYFEEAV